jgi:DNA polymerase-3 subunit gamma/tau
MSLALYRKYRSKKLGDLLGQETNVAILKNAARAGKIGHAYLFYGSRGTGKTSTARLIAKLLNCETRARDAKFFAEGEPCNACGSCEAIDANNSFDVVEIDAASNRGIDEIRNLKEHIRTAPASASHKVYIIDEAHMLTTAAFNALLKTLEEPPAHAVFVLATTEYEKLPATITSRTQRFLFKKPPKAIIIEKLSLIAKAEHIAIEDDALELIAAAGEGSFRDAESILEQVSAGQKKVDLKIVEEMTGRVGLKKVHAVSSLVVARDLAGALAAVSSLHEEGYNLVQFTKDLIHYLRKVLSLSANPSLVATFQGELTKDEIIKLAELSKLADMGTLALLLKSLIRGYSEMRYSPFAMIPLEIALVEHLK